MLEALAAVVVVQNATVLNLICRPVSFHGTVIEIGWYLPDTDELVLEWDPDRGFTSGGLCGVYELDLAWAKLLEDLR